jgi:RND superfamily putative drug exporter
VGGAAVVGDQVSTTIEEDLKRAELLAFPILFVIALFVFRGVVAAALPLIVGGIVIFLGFLGLGILNDAFEISVFALNLVIGLSLGLSIDYSLLIVNRYREELAARGPGLGAITKTLQTAGRSVLFSAITVAAALAGLMIFPQKFLFSMGIGGVLVAALAAFASLVVLPAILVVLGRRVNALALPGWKRQNESADELRDGFWYRLSQLVMRRPGIVAAATTIVLVIIALPALRIVFTTVDAGVLPETASAKQVSESLNEEFPTDFSEPIILAIDAPPGPSGEVEVESYAQKLTGLEDVAAVVPPVQVDATTWRVDVIPASPGLSDASEDLLEDIRGTPTTLDVLAGGLTASFVDERNSLASHLPLAITVIVGVTIIALFIMTGSVLLPIKAVIMNVLTLGATLGILVFVFQDGRLEGLLDYQSVGALDLTMPILMGAMAFGLSTDYAVFLISRIKEAYDQGLSNDEAVAVGLQRTGRIVTAAALLFAIAVGAFATSDITLIKQLGIGTALAVLIDATIIRAFLVPSLMKLLGDWNWWAPGPLRRLHDRIGFSESEPPDDPPAPAPPHSMGTAHT